MSIISSLLDTLSPSEQEALLTIVHPDSGWGHQSVADIITDSGTKIDEKSVRRYRREMSISL